MHVLGFLSDPRAGAFLSGAGASVMAIVQSGHGDGAAVASAMQEAADQRLISGRVIVCQPTLTGAHVRVAQALAAAKMQWTTSLAAPHVA